MTDIDQTIQTTQEYDKNLNKELVIPVGGSIQTGEINNLSVSNLSSGSLNYAFKFGKGGSIQGFDSNNNLSIYIGF